MRMIDADDLIEYVWREDLDTREKIADLVERMPTVQTDIIRCKDCRAYATLKSPSKSIKICIKLGGLGMRENDFCSYAEKADTRR